MAVAYVGELRSRLSARFHVQIELTRAPSGFQTPAAVYVDGRVVRLFRGDSSLSIGDKLTFEVNVCRRGDRLPLGPSFMLYDTFLAARYLEAFLNGSPPHCHLALDQCVALSDPTRRPHLRSSRVAYMVEMLRSGHGWKDSLKRPE